MEASLLVTPITPKRTESSITTPQASAVNAVCVDPARVHEVWPFVQTFIHAATQKSGIGDFADIRGRVLKGNALLWLAWDGKLVLAAAVTELITINGRKLCEISACGGEELERFGPLISELEQFARNEKCKGVRLIGRRGWLRKLQKYKLKGVILERGI